MLLRQVVCWRARGRALRLSYSSSGGARVRGRRFCVDQDSEGGEEPPESRENDSSDAADQGPPAPEALRTALHAVCDAVGAKQPLERGRLYVVSTPIGNLEDITLRALRVLRGVDAVLAEDTRRTVRLCGLWNDLLRVFCYSADDTTRLTHSHHQRSLLNHYGLRTACVSLHAHNEHARTDYVVSRLAAGDALALVSDAGTPGVSDPGALLVAAVIAQGHAVTPVPGCSALLTALVASGLPTHTFSFIGFLSPQPSARRKRLQALASSHSGSTLAFYMPPHKAPATLADMASILGAQRRCCVGRELTKVYEELWRGTLGDAAVEFADRHVQLLDCPHLDCVECSDAVMFTYPPSGRARGEFTLLVEAGSQADSEGAHAGPPMSALDADAQVDARLREQLGAGVAPSRAAREVAEALGVRRKDVYARALALSEQLLGAAAEGLARQ
jgi:16S rRNA (cytidine1402-2'-O)-methyltransferase